LARDPCQRAQIRRDRQTLAVEELRSKLREGKAETWAHDGVARRTKSEAKKLRATEPLGGTSTGTARKNSGEPAPIKDRNTTPHIHNNIEIKRGERHNQMQKSVFH
jgi:hypothetical protein